MKFVALVSGGKDSCFNIIQCIANGHELVALANLYPSNLEPGYEELDSFMYQTVGFPVVALYDQCMEVPLYRQPILGTPKRTTLSYEETVDDESEDLYQLLLSVKENHPDIQAVSVGAILSTYQRVRVEHICRRLNLRALAFLWQRDQGQLLNEMVTLSGLDIVLIKAAGAGLDKRHVGKRLKDLVPVLSDLNSKFGFHLCGEGGEYETLVVDGPDFLFKKKLQIVDSKLIQDSSGDVCYTSLKVAVENKQDLVSYDNENDNNNIRTVAQSHVAVPPLLDDEFERLLNVSLSEGYPSLLYEMEQPSAVHNVTAPEKALHSSGLGQSSETLWIANISANSGDIESDISTVLSCLDQYLLDHGSCTRELVMVSLLLQDLSPESFAIVNSAYANYVSHAGPPARFCVSPCSNAAFNVQMSALATKLPKVSLHVESISYWAPANIGPYSQCMTVGVDSTLASLVESRDIAFLSGQIGLVPSTMTLIDSMEKQAVLSLQHLVRVSKATSTSHLSTAVAYVTSVGAASFCADLWKRYTNNDNVVICLTKRLPRDAAVEWTSLGLTCHRQDGWKIRISSDSSHVLDPIPDYQVICATVYTSAMKTGCAIQGPVEIIPVDYLWYKMKPCTTLAISVSVMTE